MKIITVIGARPQFIKAATVSRMLENYPEINEIIIHTGQHYDKNINDIFFEELNIPNPKYHLNIGSDTHGAQTAKMLKAIEDVLVEEKPDKVMVYGDTNSTLAGALSAVKLHIPVAHVEAGLRSFNRQMPEEINRIVTDAISDYLYAPTDTALQQLIIEGRGTQSCFTGDVMYDSVLYYKQLIQTKHHPDFAFTLPDKFYLATIHRAENTDNPDLLKSIFEAFHHLNHPVIFPIHPRTKNLIQKYNLSLSKNIIVIDPVGYLDLLYLLLLSEKMITDSGGIQKEAFFLDIPCVTLRNETEWIETLKGNHNILCGTETDKILEAIDIRPSGLADKSAFGDGNAAGKIIELLLSQK